MAPARKMASFIHLRVKSAYSLLEGAVRPKELAMLAAESGMPAVAVADNNNLFGVYEIADTVAKAGVQPIVGALLSVEYASGQRSSLLQMAGASFQVLAQMGGDFRIQEG